MEAVVYALCESEQRAFGEWKTEELHADGDPDGRGGRGGGEADGDRHHGTACDGGQDAVAARLRRGADGDHEVLLLGVDDGVEVVGQECGVQRARQVGDEGLLGEVACVPRGGAQARRDVWVLAWDDEEVGRERGAVRRVQVGHA